MGIFDPEGWVFLRSRTLHPIIKANNSIFLNVLVVVSGEKLTICLISLRKIDYARSSLLFNLKNDDVEEPLKPGS